MRKIYSGKKTKRVVCGILTAAMVFSQMPYGVLEMSKNVYAETLVVGTSTFTYEMLDDGTVRITGYEGNDKEITIPAVINEKKVTVIGESAFFCCFDVEKIIVPEGVTVIEDEAFSACSSVLEISLPTTLKTIGNSAFSGCYSLEALSIPESVTNIKYRAFDACYALKTISISKNVAEIGEMAFYDCTGLTSVSVNAENPNYKSVDGVLFSKDGKNLIYYPTGNVATTYKMPEGVTDVAKYAFYNCSSIAAIDFPETLEYIGISSFQSCVNLENIDIPVSVKTIDDNAFNTCKKITEITVRQNVGYVGNNAFDGCEKLAAINVDAANESYKSENGVLFNKAGTTIIKYPQGKTSVAYQIPSGVVTIENNAFQYNENVKAIVIPGSVEYIELYAFNKCTGLTSITIPGSVKTISMSAFSGCSNLASVTLSNGLKEIGAYAFEYCGSLKEIEIPSGVTTIGFCCFDECTSLEKAYVPSSVTDIENYAFLDCNLLVIYGEVGSYIESYAEDNNIAFKQIVSDELGIKLECSNTTSNVGDKLTFTAVATGGKGEYTYSFLINNTDTGAWSRVKAFNTSNTYTWTAGSAGNRKFYAEVKDASGTVVRSSALNVVTNKSTGALAISATANTSKATLGDSVTITAKAGGGDGKYTYSYLIYSVEGKVWYRFNKTFKTANTHIWKATSTGNKKFYAEVKDGTGKVVRSSAVAVAVSDSSSTALGITATVSNATPSVGTTVTITGKATGGTAPYTYSFLIHNPAKKEWYRYGNGTFKASNTHTWKVSGTGTRNFYVEVKDSTGKVVRSKAATLAIK